MIRKLSRRTVLGSAGLGLAAAPLSMRQGLAQSDGEGVTLNFAYGPDETGSVQAMIDAFNASNEGRIKVNWVVAPASTDAFFRNLESDFLANAADIDLFASDVIWTAEFAARGWIEDLSSRIYNELNPEQFVTAALNSTYYRSRLWGVPWYTDAGMLYYRKDLLETAGATPPETWDDLASTARSIMEAEGIANGFVFQGAQYEGGVTNALEFIWSAGGRAWTLQTEVVGAFGMAAIDPNVIVINSRDSARGLDKARELITSGIAPEAVTTFLERDALRVFAGGDAVFMRNWPFAYGLLGTGEFGSVTQDQVGVAKIPTMEAGGRSYSCLGGWNFAVNADSQQKDAAWEFIKFGTETARQAEFARSGGFLPARLELYEDQALREEIPVIGLGEAAVRAARSRPSSPIYSLLSPRLAVMFNRVLTGELDGSEAVARAARELQNIVSNAGRRGR